MSPLLDSTLSPATSLAYAGPRGTPSAWACVGASYQHLLLHDVTLIWPSMHHAT